jgi:hypothetical protein
MLSFKTKFLSIYPLGTQCYNIVSTFSHNFGNSIGKREFIVLNHMFIFTYSSFLPDTPHFFLLLFTFTQELHWQSF